MKKLTCYGMAHTQLYIPFKRQGYEILEFNRALFSINISWLCKNNQIQLMLVNKRTFIKKTMKPLNNPNQEDDETIEQP
jgi:hypothetical protein